MNTTHPDRSLISSTDVEGTAIYGRDGARIGDIDHLMIEKTSGQVRYGVVSFGGFLGMGQGHHPIPWNAFRYDPQLGGFRTDITEQQLRDAPQFSDDSWSSRDWEGRIHSHYGARPYWDDSGTLGTYGAGGAPGSATPGPGATHVGSGLDATDRDRDAAMQPGYSQGDGSGLDRDRPRGGVVG